ncbi:hypothetical protein RJ639_016959 [Escallonia herrerae]|uniref:Photosynthetic NDH subcomplex B 4 n=1 Tax=Escallonia herrerae TaxID=1293975 RepID=A0AA89ALT8_9ASTE|nr:hypothetical protein RJ639_016959 [Escallonia herrerae]
MAEAVMSFTVIKPNIHRSCIQTAKVDLNPAPNSLRQCSTSGFSEASGSCRRKRGSLSKANAFPDLTLMAVLVEHIEDTFYIMFICWGCCFFGATKDPYYDSEQYRKDGGDGTGHWVYEKQEDTEESARAELWREELIEEIEQKVGGLRELEEASKREEELVQ